MANNFDPGLGTNHDDNASGAVGGLFGAIPILNVMAPGIAATLGAGGAETLRKQESANASGLQLPTFRDDPTARYQNVGNFDPTAYGTPEAAQYQTINEDPRTRAMQLQALGRLQAFGDQAADSTEALGRYNAISAANALAAQREAAVRNDMQMRGQGGSAAEFALAQQGGQAAADRAQAGTLNAAQQAALQRLAGTQAAFGAAGQLRGMDADTLAKNAAIINAFNLHNTDARNATNAANTDLRNSANLRNLTTDQTMSNANVGLGMDLLNRSDRNAMNGFGAASSKLGAVNDTLERRAGGVGDANDRGLTAGKTGYQNFKDLASMMAGGGGGMLGGGQ